MDNHLIISNLTKQKTKQNNNHNKPTKLKQSNIMATTDYPSITKIIKSGITKKNKKEPDATLSEKEQASVQRILLHLKKNEPRVRIQSHYQNSTISSTVLVLIQEINSKGKIKWWKKQHDNQTIFPIKKQNHQHIETIQYTTLRDK